VHYSRSRLQCTFVASLVWAVSCRPRRRFSVNHVAGFCRTASLSTTSSGRNRVQAAPELQLRLRLQLAEHFARFCTVFPPSWQRAFDFSVAARSRAVLPSPPSRHGFLASSRASSAALNSYRRELLGRFSLIRLFGLVHDAVQTIPRFHFFHAPAIRLQRAIRLPRASFRFFSLVNPVED